MNPPRCRRPHVALWIAPLIALGGVASVRAEDPEPLLWPTDAGQCVTSTFCEFRPDHFHSGIDISTWGTVGYRCLAVADGEISRVRVSCGGYGRAVYLKLKDGRTAVYAHLSRFSGALEDSVRAIQDRAGDAYFDREFAAGTFPVRRGDLVAFTGQSGVGVPHLHVELRDAAERPLDPLRSGLRAADTTPPWIARLALTALDPLSSVDGRSDTVILDVHPTETPNRGRLPRVIPVEGEIGLSIEADETADACRFRLAPARLELHEDDELLYAVDYDRFSFSETRLMDHQIDPRFSYSKVGRFHDLWRRPGNDLEFVNGGKADGRLRALRADERRWTIGADETGAGPGSLARRSSVQDAGERRRALRISALDAAGNVGELDVVLSFAAPPEVASLSVAWVASGPDAQGEASLAETWEDSLQVHGAVRRGGRELRGIDLEWSPDAGVTWLPGANVVPEADDSFEARLALGRRVPGSGRDGVLLRARAVDELGASGVARTTALPGAEPPDPVAPEFEMVSLGPWCELRFPATVSWQALSGGWEPTADGDSLVATLVRPWGQGVRVVLPTNPSIPMVRRWTGIGSTWSGIDPWGRPVPLEFELPPAFAPGVAPVRIVSPDGRAQVDLREDSFRSGCQVMLRSEVARAPAAPELRALGPVHFVESGHVPPFRGWDVTLTPAEETFDATRVGIFVQDGARFRYIGGERSADGSAWSTESRTLLGVGLFEDVRPPTLGAARLEERYGRLRLLFRAEDLGAGIDCDDVEVLFDGAPIAHELDDETGDVVAFPPAGVLSAREGTFELRATDRCGNASRRVETVRLP